MMNISKWCRECPLNSSKDCRKNCCLGCENKQKEIRQLKEQTERMQALSSLEQENMKLKAENERLVKRIYELEGNKKPSQKPEIEFEWGKKDGFAQYGVTKGLIRLVAETRIDHNDEQHRSYAMINCETVNEWYGDSLDEAKYAAEKWVRELVEGCYK